MVYRRGAEQMSATAHEQEFAQINGVKIKHWARPVRLIGDGGQAARRSSSSTRSSTSDGRLIGTGDRFTLRADMVFKAIGQTFVPDPLANGAAAAAGHQAAAASRSTRSGRPRCPACLGRRRLRPAGRT